MLLKYLTEDCLFTLDLKKDAGVIAIDFSKTFDSVCHNLLAMLGAYGCQESVIRLIQSYLSDGNSNFTSGNTFSTQNVFKGLGNTFV